jgi:hypothetical protein
MPTEGGLEDSSREVVLGDQSFPPRARFRPDHLFSIADQDPASATRFCDGGDCGVFHLLRAPTPVLALGRETGACRKRLTLRQSGLAGLDVEAFLLPIRSANIPQS